MKKVNQYDSSPRINCYGCTRFFITHDRHYPYGCRAMGFKSAAFPSSTVILSSGLPCQGFTPKRTRP